MRLFCRFLHQRNSDAYKYYQKRVRELCQQHQHVQKQEQQVEDAANEADVEDVNIGNCNHFIVLSVLLKILVTVINLIVVSVLSQNR